MKRRFCVFFLVLIYLCNNIFVSTTFGRFVQESTTEKFNVSATAQTVQNPLSEYSWQEIYDITVSGEAENYWSIGDKTTVKVNNEDKEVVVIGIDHDGENTVTFSFTEEVTTAAMNSIYTNVGSWENSLMRTETMPSILSQMENQDFIKEVEKQTITGGGDACTVWEDGYCDIDSIDLEESYTLIPTTDKLFLLSYTEVFGENENYNWDHFNEGTQYEYFKTENNRIMKNKDKNATSWWLRTPEGDEDFGFHQIYPDGDSNPHGAQLSVSVIPAFVIGEIVEEPSTLDLLPPFEMPEEYVAGESFIISEMPDFQVITENAMKVIPENTEFYGWLIENELAQEIFEPEDAKYILEDTYSYGEEVELRLTPVYKKVEEPKLIAVDINDLVNITIENLTDDTISNEQDFTFKFVVDKGYEIPETIEVLLNETSYVVNTNGEETPDGFTFNVETFELTISSDILSDKETLTIKATASEIVKEVVEMLDGDGSEYDINSPETLVFRSEAPLADLEVVQVNGEDLNPETDYTATEGSTIITLSEEYLSTLEIGEYTISIISTRMIANATFTVDKIVEEKEFNTENSEEISNNEIDKELPENMEKEEEILEKTIEFDTEQLYNIEITEFADFEEDEDKEIVIEDNLELEFVLEEDYVLYKNIEILIDDTQYVLDLTDEEQELEGITFDIKENILTIDFELFEENSNLVIKAIALENIPLNKLVEGEEISITELLDVEEILESIEIPENTEFVGWLINDEVLKIENIVIQDILNDILAKIYPEIEQEKVQEEDIETVLEDLENEDSTDDIEEIETLLRPIFRLVKEELNLEDYIIGEKTIITEMPTEETLNELMTSNLTEELVFYGWVVSSLEKDQIVLQEDLSNVLTEIFMEETEISLIPLYTVVEATEEQPEDVEENENAESEENIQEETTPENTEESDNQEVVPEDSIQDSETSVNEEEKGEIPEISIPTEQTLYINTNNLVNISIPELSNENIVSIANNENLTFSLETEEDYKLPETVQVVIDKTYTVNTNEKGSPEDEVTFNVLTGEITILNSLLSGIETITVKGTAAKIEKEDTETTQKETSTEKVESSENQSSNEKETVNEQTPNEELETDNILENSENTVTEPTDTNSEEDDTETDIEASLEDQEQSNETENTGQDATDIEDLSKNEENENIPEVEKSENTQNESSTENTKIELENNFVEKETDKTDTLTGVAEESSSTEQSSQNGGIPETSPISTEPAAQSSNTTNTSTQSSTTSSGSSPDPRTNNNSNTSNGNQSSSNSTGTSTSTTTTKKSESSNEISVSESEE